MSATTETSETESMGSFETDVTLDTLFGALAHKTKEMRERDESENAPHSDTESDEEDTSDLAKVKKLIDNLPKLESGLEESLAKAVPQKKDIVKINDPIVAIRKAKEEPTDAGDKWFNMKAVEMTPEVKQDLMIIKNRAALDPKRHYKKEKWEIPKFFHMGTIVEGNTEFYSSRLKRKDRGVTLVDEVLKDDKADKYFKRKYSEIEEKRKSGGREYYKKLREKRRRY